jgi:hypothetical protein
MYGRSSGLYARNREPRVAQPASHGFLREHQAMTFAQFLARQHRAEIGVALTHQREAMARARRSIGSSRLLGLPRLPETSPARDHRLHNAGTSG